MSRVAWDGAGLRTIRAGLNGPLWPEEVGALFRQGGSETVFAIWVRPGRHIYIRWPAVVWEPRAPRPMRERHDPLWAAKVFG